jgi:hypothetical protein
MKKLMIVVLLAGALSVAANGQEEGQARDLYHSYSANGSSGKAGAKIRIELLRNNRRRFVSPDTTFRAGDQVKFHFEANFPAYVRIYNRGSSGKLKRLFPEAGERSRIKALSDHVVPDDGWFVFDDKPGAENLYFSFSSEPPHRPTPPAAKKRPQPKEPKEKDVVEVRNAGDELEDEADEEIEESEWEDSRDISRMKTSNEEYVFGKTQGAEKTVRITIQLRHQ